MTGRSPIAIQMTRFSAPLGDEYKTWLELLPAGGYFTGVAGRLYHLDGSANQPSETKVVFEQHNLRTFERRLDFVKTAAGQIHISAVVQYREFLERVKVKHHDVISPGACTDG